MTKTTMTGVVGSVFFVAILLGAVYFVPWQTRRWGSLELAPARTITVTGTGKNAQKNQVAVFSAGVSSVDADREKAVQQVNQAVEKMIAEIKAFGVDEADIKTENLSIFQGEESYYVDGVQRQRAGQWRANNSVSVKLRDVDRTSEFAGLLSKSGATNVYGPNFAMDDTKKYESDLLGLALEDARTKAETIAVASGGQLGRVVSVNEGATTGGITPLYARDMGGGGGVPIEPGSQEVSKTITVVYELER